MSDNWSEIPRTEIKAPLQHFKKGSIIQKAGDLKTHAIYVKSGVLRSYVLDSSGKEHIYMFATEDWVIGDIEAMEYNQPAHLYIDCLEDAEVVILEKDSFFSADMSKEQIISNTELLFRRIGRLQRRVLMLMGSPAIDRYRYFIEMYPELPNRIPQKMIASYLGIMPQTLSTLRSKIAREE